MTKSQALGIMGLASDTGANELKKRYRALMMMTHPDSADYHEYPYDAAQINAAYAYLTENMVKEDIAAKAKEESRIHWNAPVNPNAYCPRNIYQYYDDAFGDQIGVVNVDSGRYTWIPDEDFSLFLKSLYEAAKRVIAEDDDRKGLSRADDMTLMADIAYLLSGQFFGADTALSLMKSEGGGDVYYAKAMLELSTAGRAKIAHQLKEKPVGGAGDKIILVPGKVKSHRLYVTDIMGNELGYLTFHDDRLLFGIIPLFERRAVQVKMSIADSKCIKGSIAVDFWLKLIPEDSASAIDSINLRIRQALDR